MSADEESGRESLEPPRDSWRPPAPDAPLELNEPDVSARPKQVLIAGIGNAWQRDDGFGSEVARRIEARELPDGCLLYTSPSPRD